MEVLFETQIPVFLHVLWQLNKQPIIQTLQHKVLTTLLHRASSKGCTSIVNVLLLIGAQIEASDKEGHTPLWFAAANGQAHVVRALMSAGADVNTQNNNGISALGFASWKGYINLVNVLLENGAKIETRDKYGRTSLYFAAANGQTDVVRALVSAGADVNTQNNNGYSPLNIASQLGYTDVVNVLLNNRVDIETRESKGRTPLWYAAAARKTDVVRALVSAGADVNTQRNDGDSPLIFTSYKGYIDIVNMLLDNGAELETRNNKGCTPLWIAAGAGQTDVVRALVSAGADVNTQRNDGISALAFACQQGFIDIVNILLDNGAETETKAIDNRTPLWFAAFNGQTDVVRALVAAGADVNAQHNDGSSALTLASEKGYIDIVKIVLDNGAEIETKDGIDRSPLCFATIKGQTDVVRALVSAGADVNIQRLDIKSKDPLSAAAIWCEDNVDEILQLLITNGSCVNSAKHGMNQSALMLAVHRGRLDIVKMLTQYGADIYDRNFDNMQPIDVASFCGHVDIVQFLSSSNTSAAVLRCCSLNTHTSATALRGRGCSLYSDVGVDCRCNTAMHLITDLQIMLSLLENGADVEAENVDGLRPIHCAVRTKLVELVELLIQHGANVDAADVFGNRPLHEAVSHGLRVVQLLVQRGAKLNVQNIDGKTPLHIAVERQQSDVILFLLSQDVDVGLTDVWRNTPLHYFTNELAAVSEVAESVVNVPTKCRQYNPVRNCVGVSMSLTTRVISDNQCQEEQYYASNCTKNMAQPLSNDHMTHNVSLFLNRQISDVDCYGNTPLHYAVGVYGQPKMFKVSTDVTNTVDFLVKCGVDINAQNKDGLTPLHVARGEKAVEACLRHANDQSFTITDKQGRNFWHLLFLIRIQNEVELGTSIRPLIAVSDSAKYNVDDFNRTPLHYACMSRNPWIREWDWLVEAFIKNFSDEHVNKQDRFGRTALHYAALVGNRELKRMLKTKNVDDTIEDNYQMTSHEFKKIGKYFLTQMSKIGLRKSSSFIEKHYRDISACIHDYFADSSTTAHESKVKIHEIVRNLTDDCDKANYVLNIWRRCRYDYGDITCGLLDLLEQADHQPFCKQEDILLNKDGSATEQISMFTAIQTHVNKAMEELAKAITEHDHRFACEVIPVGSAYEGTKIGCCDEFDFNFVLTNLSSMCEVCYSPESPPGFVQLKASATVHDEDMKDLFNQNGVLNTRIIKFKFETLAKQVLSSTSFCDLTDFLFVDSMSLEEFGLTRGNVAAKLNTCVELAFTKPVNKRHVPHGISIDLVPALRINDWWPEDARRKELCRAGDCLIVLTQPQSKYPWIGWTEPHGFISFARAESRLLRESHPVVKAAYMVVKRMSEYFCQYNFFASHVIKTALFWCLNEEDLMKYRSSQLVRNDILYTRIHDTSYSDEVQGVELLLLVQNILRRLLCFAAQDYVPCYFLPKCHQPVWLKERYLKQYHMRLYQHGLTYKDLFSLSEQQSHDEVLISIKTMFTFSHLMYWSVLSDNDDLKFFIPSTINPLREVSYDDSDE